MEDEILEGGGGGITPTEFSQKVKAKYPQYKDIDDVELAKRMIVKYPQYKNQVNFETPEPSKGVNAGEVTQQNGDSASPSANGEDYLSVLPQTSNAEFEQPNLDFYNKINKSISKFKILRDGSGNVTAYDPEKQTPEFDPRSGNVTINNNPSGQVSAKILDRVKEEAGIPDKVISALDKGEGKVKYLKDVSDYLRLVGGDFEGKTADEAIEGLGVNFQDNAKALKENIDSEARVMPFFEHEGKEIESAKSSDGLKRVVGDIDQYGFNMQDFDKYLESSNPRMKELIDKGLIGIETDISGSTRDISTEMQIFKNLRNYTVDRNKYLNNVKSVLDYRKSNGEDVDNELSRVKSEQTALSKGLKDYTKENLTEYVSFLENKREQTAKKYEKYKSGESNVIEDTLENVTQGFFGGIQEMAIFIGDGLGAENFAEEGRLAVELQDITESDTLESSIWERGKVVTKNGVKYGVTKDGQIIDIEEKLNVTSIVDKIGINQEKLIAEAANSEEDFNMFSARNTTIQGGQVMGNLAFQIAGTKGIGAVVGNSTKAMVASNMVMTGGMVYTSTYEDALQTLRDQNIPEANARRYANEVAMATGSIAALTSIISPNQKAQQLFSKQSMNNLVKNALRAEVEGGKKAMFKSIKEATVKSLYSGSKEGLEEVVQENLEYITERLTSANVNDKIGKEVLEEDITMKDIVNNSILAFGASSAFAGLGDLKQSGYSQDKLDVYNLLSQDFDKLKKHSNEMVKKGSINQDQADKLIEDVEKFIKFSNKTPEGMPKEKTFDIIDKLDSRDKLEQRKVKEDKAFHPYINEEIAKVDASIAETLGLKLDKDKDGETKTNTRTKPTNEKVEGETKEGEVNTLQASDKAKIDSPELVADKVSSKSIKESTSEVSAKIRKLKVNSTAKEAMSKLSATAGFEVAWDGALEAVALSVDAAGSVAQATSDGIKALKNSEWYKSLSDEGKNKAEVLLQDTLRRELPEVEKEKTPFTKKKEAFIENFNQKIVDKLFKVRKEVNQKVDTSNPDLDFSTAEKLLSGKTASELEAFDSTIYSISKDYSSKGLKLDKISDYLYAKHAIERNTYIRTQVDPENEAGSGITDQEATSYLESLTSDEKANLEEVSQKVQSIIQETRDILKDSGLISEEEYNAFTDFYDNYVPLQGFDNQDIDTFEKVEGAGLSIKGKEGKKSGGRSTKADNILANVIRQRTSAVIRARKNEVLQKLYNIGVSKDNKGVLEVFHSSEMPKIDSRKELDYFVGVKVNGEQYQMKFANKELGKLLNNSSIEKNNLITKTLGKFNRYLSTTLTTLNPDFVVSNFLRDIQTAYINLNSEADINKSLDGNNLANKAVKNVFKSISTIYKSDRGSDNDSEYSKYYQEFKEAGAKTGWANQSSLQDIKKKLENLESLNNAKGLSKDSIKKGFKASLDFVNSINNAVENGVRLSSYIQARKKGLSVDQAGVLAKELTVNFNQSGEWGSVANSIFLFFNAAVQGNVRFVKAVSTRKTNKDGSKSFTRAQKIAMGVVGFSSLLTLLNQGISDDDEDGESFFSKIPDYEKERNMILMIDGKNYIKVPLPYGYNLFHNLGSITTEIAMGDRSIGDGVGAITSSTIGAFSPINFGGDSDDASSVITSAITPTVLKPLFEINKNENHFGSSIYNEDLFGSTPSPDATKGRKNTPEAFKNVALFLNNVTGGNEFESGSADVAPESLYHVYKFMIGGTGKFGSNVVETISNSWDKDKEVEVNKVPFLRKVYATPNEYVDQTTFTERLTLLNQRVKTLKGKKDFNKVARVQVLFKQTNTILKKLRNQRKIIDKISDNGIRSKKLEALDKEVKTLISRANKKFNVDLGKIYD